MVMLDATLDASRVTTAQAARRLGVSRQAVRYMLVAGRLDYITTPLGRLIDPTSVERLREQRERRTSRNRVTVGATSVADR